MLRSYKYRYIISDRSNAYSFHYFTILSFPSRFYYFHSGDKIVFNFLFKYVT